MGFFGGLIDIDEISKSHFYTDFRHGSRVFVAQTRRSAEMYRDATADRLWLER